MTTYIYMCVCVCVCVCVCKAYSINEEIFFTGILSRKYCLQWYFLDGNQQLWVCSYQKTLFIKRLHLDSFLYRRAIVFPIHRLSFRFSLVGWLVSCLGFMAYQPLYVI